MDATISKTTVSGHISQQEGKIATEPRTISLFAGCGGLDLGFHNSGFNIVWANDNFREAALTYEKNIGPIDTRDITKVDANEVPDADIVIGGFPCQPFSNAGNRKGTADSRGTLFWDAMRFVKAKDPKVVVFENVRGLLSIKNPDGTKLIAGIIRELEEAGKGYNVKYELLRASDYGVPQNRYRVVIVGVRKDLGKSFIFPEKQSREGLELKHVLKGMPINDPNDEHWELSPQSKKLIIHIPPGGSWKSVPIEHLPERLLKIRADMKRYHAPNFYRRFGLNEISGTVTAAATPENSGILHPFENRRFTVREIARIQTFPDWFIFQGKSTSSKYKQIGNAVPPQLGAVIAREIRKQIFA